MLKSILAVVVGYVVLVVVAVPVFGLVYLAPDFVFEQGQAKATLVFSLCTMVAGLAGAIAGGWVAARIASPGRRPALVLAALVLGLGLAMAIVNATAAPAPEKTPEEIARLSIAERAELAREPLWYSFSMPLVAALGVVIGARPGRRSVGSADPETDS